MRRFFGALLAAGGLALILVLGMQASAGAGGKDDKKDPYVPTTVTTILNTSTSQATTTSSTPDTTPVTVQQNILTRSTPTSSATLPVTGSDVAGLTLLGAGVLAVGGGLVWYSRRSQAKRSEIS